MQHRAKPTADPSPRAADAPLLCLGHVSFSDAVDAFGKHAAKANLAQQERMKALLDTGPKPRVIEADTRLMVTPGMSFSFKRTARKSCHADPRPTTDPMALCKHPDKRFGLEMTVMHGTSNLTQGIDEDHIEQLQMIAATTVKDKGSGTKGKAKKKGRGAKLPAGGLHNPRPFTVMDLPGTDNFANVCLCLLLRKQGVLQILPAASHNE